MKQYHVDEKVTIWITGIAATFDAVVVRVDADGQPDRLAVDDWPTLKPGDFIIKDQP